MTKEWWQHPELQCVPMHVRMDDYNAILVKEQGLTKCKDCGSTGNRLYSMHQKCDTCNGTGNMEMKDLSGIKSKWLVDQE